MTNVPTVSPTITPTDFPTILPSSLPTEAPTAFPTDAPSTTTFTTTTFTSSTATLTSSTKVEVLTTLEQGYLVRLSPGTRLHILADLVKKLLCSGTSQILDESALRKSTSETLIKAGITHSEYYDYMKDVAGKTACTKNAHDWFDGEL